MGKANKQNAKSVHRRWFADMSGWGVSLQLGSGEPSKGRRSLPVNGDAKFMAVYVSMPAASHSTLYTFNPLSNISQGTASNQRVGSGINLKSISFRYTVNSPLSAATIWRIMVVASTAQYTGAGFGSGLGMSQLFFSTNGYPINNHVDSRIAKLLCDDCFIVQPTVSGQPASHFGFVDCQINTPFEFQSSGIFGSNANIYLVFTPYFPGGVTGSTVCGDISGEVVTCWTD